VKDDGAFIYGRFPCFDKEIGAYNAIRHCLSVISLMEAYELSGDESYREAIRSTYRYYMNRFVVYAQDGSAVVVDWDNSDEIRLGTMGLSIIMILKYAELFGDQTDMGKALGLAETVMRLQNRQTGEFVHVLSYPSLDVKDRFRVVYYPGEACYGLLMLYAHVRDDRYLQCVEKAFDFFIANHYERYYDHWLSYSVNELTKYRSDDKYYIFGIQNAFRRLDFITARITTWPTFLELLNAAFAMTERIREQGREHLFEGYDLEKFYNAIEVRMIRQQNGVLFPELAMFFQRPSKILYGVFIRHHFFRIRDDDVAHHIVGYCHFISNVLPKLPLKEDSLLKK
jgi:hypothetical protein